MQSNNQERLEDANIKPKKTNRRIHTKNPKQKPNHNNIITKTVNLKIQPLKQTKLERNEKNTSAARYSRTAARYTGAPAPTRSAYLPAFKNRAIRPTGNCNPALLLLDVAFFDAPEPRVLPLPAISYELLSASDAKFLEREKEKLG